MTHSRWAGSQVGRPYNVLRMQRLVCESGLDPSVLLIKTMVSAWRTEDRQPWVEPALSQKGEREGFERYSYIVNLQSLELQGVF